MPIGADRLKKGGNGVGDIYGGEPDVSDAVSDKIAVHNCIHSGQSE